MTQILKRLEIIKSSIAIEDEEIIELQVMKLQKLDIDNNVKAIVTNLEAMNYAKAMKDIEAYILRYSGVVEYVDSEVQGLKLELKSLESKLQELVEQKTEYLNDIEEFNREYNLHLGELIKDILNLKKEILYKKTIKQQKQKVKYQEDIQTFQESKETIDELKSTITELEEALETIDEDDENYDELSHAYNELKEELEKLEDELELQEEELNKAKEFIEDESIEQEYEEVKSHYEEFESEYEHIKESIENSLTLNEEEKKELKSLYKQAARLCHPDIVPDELKEKAHEFMQKLNDAYSKKDIGKIKEILYSLQNGTSFELSSETIEDKELIRAKIKEYLKNIETIKSEIEEIKEDETYQVIAELDDWDEYFEELRGELEAEKEKLEEEAREVLEEKEEKASKVSQIIKEETPDWMRKLWDWADEHNIPNTKLSRKKENLLNAKILDLTDIKLSYLQKEIVNLESLQELILWGCDLKYLPRNIDKLTTLKKLNLRGNPDLRITVNQNNWIENLSKKAVVFKENIGHLDYAELTIFEEELLTKYDFSNQAKLTDYVIEWMRIQILKKYKLDINYDSIASMRVKDESKKVASELIKDGISNINLAYLSATSSGPIHFLITNVTFETLNIKRTSKEFGNEIKSSSSAYKKKEKTKKITKENSPYAKHIQSIENIKFEKIRKYCENLSKANKADGMQKQLGEKGKMYKALIYDALEQFILELNGETITLCDWGCSQGIASMLVLDYIKEKQLDIKVSDVILIDDDTKSLSRAMAQVEALAQESIKFTPIKSDDNNISDTIKSNKNNTILHLFANDNMPIDFLEIDFDIFDKDFVLCVSNENREFVDEVYENFEMFMDVQDLSILDGKIGRFDKFERVFTVSETIYNTPTIDIDNDEIPF